MGISMKELKNNRLTPAEKYILDFIDGVEPKTYPSGNVGWYKDGKCLFIQYFENVGLYVNDYNILSVLEVEFGLNRLEIQEFIYNVMYDYTDNGKLKVIY